MELFRIRRSLVRATLTTALLCSAIVVSAQLELGTILGVVKDEAGQPIEGVVITIKDVERGRETDVKTDKSGKFFKRGLQAVEYEFTVAKPGYSPIKDKLKVNAGIEKRYDFKLVKAAPEGSEDFAKGVAAFNRGDNTAAAAAFEEAVKKAPAVAELRVNLALAYVRLSRTSDAVTQLEEARRIAPDKPGVMFQLGEAYVDMKDLDKAIAAFEGGLAKQSDLKDAATWQATVTLGATYFAKGNNDKAKELFDQAIAANPQAAAPKLGLGKVLFSKGDVNGALNVFEQIVAMTPPPPEAEAAKAFIAELKKTKG